MDLGRDFFLRRFRFFWIQLGLNKYNLEKLPHLSGLVGLYGTATATICMGTGTRKSTGSVVLMVGYST